jgi:hypothetical protein
MVEINKSKLDQYMRRSRLYETDVTYPSGLEDCTTSSGSNFCWLFDLNLNISIIKNSLICT